ncbi:MAG TPA: toll/interleukin-1 receptor domain-containing protein [Actinophytocola sp.]|uniref:toll/interleukin-1 receptor domain-containing protein n=1 Tax=Actinophytocola sp. TaxID=1872138 RepID=UPI002DFA2438|nr:toll/interleukin-1 receptor domain-containing protein [Actinophytocola sp.]
MSGYARSALTAQLATVAKARAGAIEQRDTGRVAKLLGLENCLQSLVELDNKILSVQQEKFSAHDSSQALELREQEEALRKQRAELDELRELVTHEVDLEPDIDDEQSPSERTDNNEPPPSPLIRVFISYRREHTSHFAGRISDWLIGHLGENQVFMDVDSIELGVDFKEVITDAVGQCAVLVAVIGPQWATMCDESGKRRLTQPDDIVRLEVEAALRRNIRVIPVLVDGAEMPDPRQLPESLAALARRNALKIRHESFRQDVRRLLQAVEKPQ